MSSAVFCLPSGPHERTPTMCVLPPSDLSCIFLPPTSSHACGTDDPLLPCESHSGRLKGNLPDGYISTALWRGLPFLSHAPSVRPVWDGFAVSTRGKALSARYCAYESLRRAWPIIALLARPVRQAMAEELNTIVRTVISIPSKSDATRISISVKPYLSLLFTPSAPSGRPGSGLPCRISAGRKGRRRGG